MALDAKSKLGVVDGSITASMAITPLEKIGWSKNNSMISSWILNFVSPHITTRQLQLCKEMQQWLLSSLIFELLGINCLISGLYHHILVVNVSVEWMTKSHSFIIKILWCNFSMAWMKSIHKSGLKFWWWNQVPQLTRPFFGDTRGKAEGFMFQWRHFSWFNCSCSQDSKVKSRWEEQQRQGQTYMHPLWQVGHFMEKCYKLVGFPPGYKQEGKVSMANQVTLDGDSGQSEAASQSGSFPFIAEQCQ